MRFQKSIILAFMLLIPSLSFASWSPYPSSSGTVLSAREAFTDTYHNVTVSGESAYSQTVSRSYDTVQALYDAYTGTDSVRLWRYDELLSSYTSAYSTDSSLSVRIDTINSYISNPDGTLTAEVVRNYYPVTVGGSSPVSVASYESFVSAFNPSSESVIDKLFASFDLSRAESLVASQLLICVLVALCFVGYRLITRTSKKV